VQWNGIVDQAQTAGFNAPTDSESDSAAFWRAAQSRPAFCLPLAFYAIFFATAVAWAFSSLSIAFLFAFILK